MVVGDNTNRLVRKQDLVHIAILLAVALGIGVYLIATAVLIAKDGVFYIERAQKFSSDPVRVIKALYSFGYPFLIFIVHQFVTFFSNSSWIYSWIYCAQSVTLLCRILSLIPLYFIGKILVGPRNSFWALLILTLLPYPTKFGSDALSDWPHIVFLVTGFWLLLLGAKFSKWWMFGCVGIIAGLGYLIRTECCQLVIYGGGWLLFNLIRPKNKMSRKSAVGALVLLLAGFAVIAVPYMRFVGYLFPEHRIGSVSIFANMGRSNIDAVNEAGVYFAGFVPMKVAEGIWKLLNNICETLMYYFIPALFIGVYYYFRKQTKSAENFFFVTAFVLLNIVVLLWLYYRTNFTSKRHSLPLVVFTIFYVPTGLQVLANWLRSKFLRVQPESKGNPQLCFFILLIIGVAICLPKLLRPMRIKKEGYRTASAWLKENAAEEDLIAVFDRRISFYAERKGIVYKNGDVPASAAYAVIIAQSEKEKRNFNVHQREDITNAAVGSKRGVFSPVQKRYVSSKGLVGYWPANSNTLDYSGHNNHGILHGRTGYTTGKRRHAFQLNRSTGDYVNCGNNASLSFGTGDFSISAWIKTSVTDDEEYMIYSSGKKPGTIARIYLEVFQKKARFRVGGTAFQHSVAINDGKWHHVVGVADRDVGLTIYVDGKAESGRAADTYDLTFDEDTLIGSYSNNPNKHQFDGSIDEVVVFNRALSEEEIEVLYYKGGGIEIMPTIETPVNANSLVGYWRMKEEYSLWVDKQKKRKKLVIYKMM